MLKRSWSNDAKMISRTFKSIKLRSSPIWIVLYPEGTRKTLEKMAVSKKFAVDRGLPDLDMLMIPRTKGFIATVNVFLNNLGV